MNVESIEALVRQELADIVDPETGLSIMRMDVIHDIIITGGVVSLVFRPSSPVCPMAYSLAYTIKRKLEALRQVDSAKIKVENFQYAAHLEGLLQSTGKGAQGKVD